VTGWVLLLAGGLLLRPGSVRYRLRARRVRVALPWTRKTVRSPEQIAEVIAALRDELRAGGALRPSLERAVQSAGVDVCPEALAVSRMGGDVPPALRSDAHGEPLLLSLAALWQVCEGSGGALAAALDRLVESARQGARTRREIRAQLAGPRATMKVLAGLPVVGVGMGFLMGANPLAFLLGSVWGWACLILAVLLEAGGVAWTRRLVRGIESQI
jgi:tight adherence protein B